MASGAYNVFQAFAAQIQASGLSVTTEFRPEDKSHDLRLNKSGCQGFCQMGPLVTLLPEGILYNKVKVEDVPEIVSHTLAKGQLVERLLYVDPGTKKRCKGVEEIPFYQRQQRFVLSGCGTIDPESIEEYIARRRLPGGAQGVHRHDARNRSARKWPSRDCGAAAAAASPPAGNGKRPGRSRTRRSTSSATPTKATRARS